MAGFAVAWSMPQGLGSSGLFVWGGKGHRRRERAGVTTSKLMVAGHNRRNFKTLNSVDQNHFVWEALVAPTLKGQKVLLVEDEYLLADEIKNAVLRLGGEPLGPVPSVRQALALLKNNDPDFAILNIRLGSEVSFPVADELLRRGCPYVFASASPKIDIPERHRQVPLWSKPINIAELVGSLASQGNAA